MAGYEDDYDQYERQQAQPSRFQEAGALGVMGDYYKGMANAVNPRNVGKAIAGKIPQAYQATRQAIQPVADAMAGNPFARFDAGQAAQVPVRQPSQPANEYLTGQRSGANAFNPVRNIAQSWQNYPAPQNPTQPPLREGMQFQQNPAVRQVPASVTLQGQNGGFANMSGTGPQMQAFAQRFNPADYAQGGPRGAPQMQGEMAGAVQGGPGQRKPWSSGDMKVYELALQQNVPIRELVDAGMTPTEAMQAYRSRQRSPVQDMSGMRQALADLRRDNAPLMNSFSSSTRNAAIQRNQDLALQLAGMPTPQDNINAANANDRQAWDQYKQQRISQILNQRQAGQQQAFDANQAAQQQQFEMQKLDMQQRGQMANTALQGAIDSRQQQAKQEPRYQMPRAEAISATDMAGNPFVQIDGKIVPFDQQGQELMIGLGSRFSDFMMNSGLEFETPDQAVDAFAKVVGPMPKEYRDYLKQQMGK